MKNYFSFKLTWQKLLPIWILFLVFFIIPYGFLVTRMSKIQTGDTSVMYFFPLLLLMFFIAFILTFYLVKLTIENIAYKDQTIVFSGGFGKYIGKVLLGFLLTAITLGIYSAWFITDLQRFFVDNSSLDSHPFKFKSTGGKLFLILLLSIIIPILILSVLFVMVIPGNVLHSPSYMIIQQVLMMFILIPYFYLVYKWMVNIDYNDFNISWKTEFWSSCSKIGLEMILIFITFGIYMPLAMLRLYKYFAARTRAVSGDSSFSFGYEIDQLNDFLFIWGQTLLTIITLGIYYPWAYCKVGSRILGKTFTQQD